MGNQPTTLIDPTTSHKAHSPPRGSLGVLVKRLSLSKLHISKKKKSNYYPVPANAERPSPPSVPEVFQDQDQYFILRWDPPAYDGGCPIIGFVIQHLELGLPQLESQYQDDAESWYSSEPGQITQTECILNNLVPGTTYQFRVVAENLIGYSQPSDISEPIVFNPHGELDDWFYAPTFTCTLDETYTVMEHEMLTLSVELKGQPYPMIRWYDKNDQELSGSSKKYKMRSSGFTRTLIITSVELSDAGMIKCVGLNKEGQVECSTFIQVEAPPRIKRVQNPEFLQNPYDVNAKEEERLNTYSEDDYEDLIFQAGELVRLKFLFSGSPKPDILLFHNGELVEDPRIVTEFTEKVITIRVENILRCDRGEWLVKLENVLGEDCTSVLITITDHPAATGQPEILQLSDNTCILRWDVPEDDGGCPIHNYIVEYYRAEWGVWLKALTSKTPGAKVKDLIPGSKYRFRVKAENLYGVSEPSEESAEILITDTPSSRNNELMTTVQESMEEDPEELLSAAEFQEEEEAELAELAERKLEEEKIMKKRSPVPPPTAKPAQEQSDKKLYSRSDLIPSAVSSSVDYVQRFLNETKDYNNDEDADDEYEYDFEKLQKEYEEEMRALKGKLEDTSDEELEDDEESDNGDEIFPPGEMNDEKWIKVKDETQQQTEAKMETSTTQAKTEPKEVVTTTAKEIERPKQIEQSKQIEPEPEPEEIDEEPEPEIVWPRRRVIRSEEKVRTTLPDRFTDYLTMKIASKDKRIGSSMRSLNSSSKSEEKFHSRENLGRMLDFEDDSRCQSRTEKEEEVEDDGEVRIQEIRKAIIQNEKKLEAEKLERKQRKEEQQREAEEAEAALEAKRRARRTQVEEVKVEEEVALVVDTKGRSNKLVIFTLILLMIPVDIFFGVYVMLLTFVLLILLWNKYKRS